VYHIIALGTKLHTSRVRGGAHVVHMHIDRCESIN
jgi:hypothetical protein